MNASSRHSDNFRYGTRQFEAWQLPWVSMVFEVSCAHIVNQQTSMFKFVPYSHPQELGPENNIESRTGQQLFRQFSISYLLLDQTDPGRNSCRSRMS